MSRLRTLVSFYKKTEIENWHEHEEKWSSFTRQKASEGAENITTGATSKDFVQHEENV